MRRSAKKNVKTAGVILIILAGALFLYLDAVKVFTELFLNDYSSGLTAGDIWRPVGWLFMLLVGLVLIAASCLVTERQA